MKRWMLLCVLGLLAGCASASARSKLPYEAWSLGFLAPAYMEVWVETADVEDIDGLIIKRAGAGTASIGYSGNPAGWPDNPAAGSRQVVGSNLPNESTFAGSRS